MDFKEKNLQFFIKTNIQANQTGPVFAKVKQEIQLVPLNTADPKFWLKKRYLADSRKMYENLPIVMVVYEQMKIICKKSKY